MSVIRRNFAEDRRVCDAASHGPWLVAEGISTQIRQPNVSNRRRIVLPPDANGINDARFIAEAREGWPAALAEIERLRGVLERMDDRKSPMMPRSAMAHLAREALDYGT
ncbi:hypothetical protein [Cohnella silvisoli]|uniref:Uncharacterized protein n=1 Tax=Cohnella silvisoli TaxID=2873699 RepID=A0ABV1KYT0_9BACL|nr:hypothetical protein [Cohnella silvisoli]MCD9024379.1 hypothetical protein [Cohnella silvisoli]